MSEKNVSEQPVLDRIYQMLLKKKQPLTFYELIEQVPTDHLSEEERADYLARIYTNINLDGQFLSLGNNFWGLKQWYPMEQRDEEVASKLAPVSKRKRKKSDEDFEDEDLGLDNEFEDEEELFNEEEENDLDFDEDNEDDDASELVDEELDGDFDDEDDEDDEEED